MRLHGKVAKNPTNFQKATSSSNSPVENVAEDFEAHSNEILGHSNSTNVQPYMNDNICEKKFQN